MLSNQVSNALDNFSVPRAYGAPELHKRTYSSDLDKECSSNNDFNRTKVKNEDRNKVERTMVCANEIKENIQLQGQASLARENKRVGNKFPSQNRQNIEGQSKEDERIRNKHKDQAVQQNSNIQTPVQDGVLINRNDNVAMHLVGSKYPQFRNENSRLSTYDGWPLNLKSPVIMSDAGFYSTNNGDCVRCFHCGVGLRHWDPEDDPWVEHARWSTKCKYLLQKKGQAFVNLVQAAVRQSEIEKTLSQNARSGGLCSSDLETDCDNQRTAHLAGNRSSDFSSFERRNPLLTNAAQSVLQMGYLPKVLKKAVDKVLQTKGWDGFNIRNIMEEIFVMESENEQKLKNCRGKEHENITSSIELACQKDLKNLKEENQELKERRSCKICCENDASIVFLPCGHLVCCAQCAPALKDCPICRTRVKGTVRVNPIE